MKRLLTRYRGYTHALSVVLPAGTAMLAFAINSILCRMALGEKVVDAASFSSIRLLSGAAMLACMLLWRKHGSGHASINPVSTLMLFIYAICFSFSYLHLTAGTGALILFGAVQLTMILYGLARGARHGAQVWVGLLAAFAGLVYLLLPGIRTPPLAGAMLMAVAGVAWGVYSIRGRNAEDAISCTAWNFIGTVPLALLTWLVFHADIHLTTEGVALAIASGALASALGYIIWYSVLPRLTPTSAASIQLSVPVIAAIGGVVLLAEPITFRLATASFVVLGGIYLTIRPARTGA